MSENQQEWFIAERTRALAMVTLTRRDDLVVRNPGFGIGLQLLVYIIKEPGEQLVRQFGLFLNGTRSATTESQLNQTLLPRMQEILSVGQFPYPVLLFHFTMDDDQGYFTWVAEPAVTGGVPQLLMHDTPHCRKLDRAAMDEIVGKVAEWYSVFFARLSMKAS